MCADKFHFSYFFEDNRVKLQKNINVLIEKSNIKFFIK